jgi:UDP-2,3-diacylglucosamine hydrolase
MASTLLASSPSAFQRTRPVGLLAGSGRFPIAFATKAKALGIPVACVGVRYEASTELIPLVDSFHWCGVARMGRMVRCFRKEGVEQIVMAGKITKAVIYSPFRIFSLMPDLRTIRYWYRRTRRDNRDDSLLLGLIEDFATSGLHFASALDFCPELLVKPGILTRRQPSVREQADIKFGWELAKEMGRLDVGQSVAVKERSTLAIEAIEGTDRAIARAGELCRSGGFVVVKVAKPQQDRRFDVPTIGQQTIETLHKAGGRVLAVEANNTILLDEAETIALADRYGLSVVAL